MSDLTSKPLVDRLRDWDTGDDVTGQRLLMDAADEIERLQSENECISSWAPDVQAQIDDLTKFTSTELLPSKPPGWAGHYGGSSLKTAIHYLREYMRLRASVEPCSSCENLQAENARLFAQAVSLLHYVPDDVKCGDVQQVLDEYKRWRASAEPAAVPEADIAAYRNVVADPSMHDKRTIIDFLEHTLDIIDRLRRASQPPPARDKGPWTVQRGSDGMHGVASDDFQHDVWLDVNGDFGDEETHEDYCHWLARKLNGAAEPPKPAHEREPPHCSTCSCGMATEPPAARRDVVAVIQDELDAAIGPGATHVPMANRIAVALGAADLLWREGEPPDASHENCQGCEVCAPDQARIWLINERETLKSHLRDARLEWGMVCACDCPACDKLFDQLQQLCGDAPTKVAPPGDRCGECDQPLPPVTEWSMPTCPACLIAATETRDCRHNWMTSLSVPGTQVCDDCGARRAESHE